MEKKVNIFSRVLVIVIIIFIAILLVLSFFWGESKFSLTVESIVLILLLVVLALAEVFDDFNIGNLISIKKEKVEKENELKEIKSENRVLRTQLINVVSNSITNRNMNIFGFSKDSLMQIAGIEQAESSAVEEKKEEDFASTNKNFVDRSKIWRALLPKIEKLALDRFCTQFKISPLSIVREVKFSNEFVGFDPIMDKNIIFDAYYKTVQEELFIEVKIMFSLISINIFSIYYLISRVYYYRKANQSHARVILIIPRFPESYWKKQSYPRTGRTIDKLQETFAPAIKNNILEIVSIEITQEDLDAMNKEIEIEEKIENS